MIVRILNRISWLLLCVGIAGMVIGITLPSIGMGDAGRIHPDEFRGRVYFAAGDIWVKISVSDGEQLSFYVLDWNSSMELVRTQSLDSTTPAFALENITHYEGTITIPACGFYSFITQNLNNETVSFQVDMTRRLPQHYIFYPAVGITSIALILFSVSRFRKTKSRMSLEVV
jgi:hypothetical protein